MGHPTPRRFTATDLKRLWADPLASYRSTSLAPEAAFATLGRHPGDTGGRRLLGGLLHTVEDARTYMLTLPKTRKLRGHWQHVRRLVLQKADAAALTQQVQLALFMRG